MDIQSQRRAVVLHKPDSDGSEPPKQFTFDYAYGPDSRQIDVFNELAKPICDSVMGGYNGTIFAYGQTGTGKTFSMEGVKDNLELRGIMPNSFEYLVSAVANHGKDTEFLIRMSFLEIYKEEVYDLLSKKGRQKMDVKEDKERGVFVKDLNNYVVKTFDEMMQVLDNGQMLRSVGATAMNAGSSRSHSILTVTVESSVMDEAGEARFKVGKLNLVDLAGSERQKRTEATGDRLDEAKSINLSLSALGNVINALVSDKAKHIPFRDSKLTRLLQDSLGGNTKTSMMAALGPAVLSYDETLSTLRYANRAKNIKNKPKINEDPKDAMLREMQDQIAMLKAQLLARQQGGEVDPELLAELMRKMAAHTGQDASMIGAPGEAEKVVEEKIIERVEVVDTGITEADMDDLNQRLEEEARHLKGKTDEEKERWIDMQKKVEEKAILKQKELDRQQAKMEKEKNQILKITEMLQDSEGRIQRGEKDVELAKQTQEEMSKLEEKIKLQHEVEEKNLKELEAAEEAELLLEEQYANAAEESKVKSKKMKKLWVKLGEKKEDLEDLQEEFALEREDLVDTIRALDRQIKLKHLISDTFVPPTYVEMVEQNAMWDSVNDRWLIGGLQYATNNIQRSESRNMMDPSRSQYVRYMDPTITNFDPSQSAEMEARFRAAMNTQGPTPQKDVFFSYGPSAEKKKKKRR